MESIEKPKFEGLEKIYPQREEEKEEEVLFPEDLAYLYKFISKGLTQKDIALVLAQCKIQRAETKKEIEGFASTYLEAKELTGDLEKLKNLKSQEIEGYILRWGELIDRENKKGFRIVPATFGDGSKALDHRKIPHAIEMFCEGFSSYLADSIDDERLSADILYKEFEKIHPFEDGNGRVGHLLWALAVTSRDGEWPDKLPPNIFDEKRNSTNL